MKGSLAETTYLIRGRPEVVKRFNNPLKLFVANSLWFLATILSGHPHLPQITSQVLLQNEVRGREAAARLGLMAPKISRIGDEYILQEYISAYNALDYYRGFYAERARLLYRYGERLSRLHQAKYSKGDTRIQNLLVTRKDQLVDVDYEMSGQLSELRRCLDVYVFLHSLGVETSAQRQIFFNGYGSKPKEPWPLALCLGLGMPLFNIYYDLKSYLSSVGKS